MGLAASQARFLGITARKSNIEYEGQQVNQQRTALAQEVNALYSRLTALQVPVAPSPEDYYTTNYTFTIDQQSDEYYGPLSYYVSQVLKKKELTNNLDWVIDVKRLMDSNLVRQNMVYETSLK